MMEHEQRQQLLLPVYEFTETIYPGLGTRLQIPCSVGVTPPISAFVMTTMLDRCGSGWKMTLKWLRLRCVVLVRTTLIV